MTSEACKRLVNASAGAKAFTSWCVKVARWVALARSRVGNDTRATYVLLLKCRHWRDLASSCRGADLQI